MALSQRLEIRQSHALVMTPQLMQAIKLLQLSNLDLATYVEGELERNPLLERIEGEGEGDRRTADGGASPAPDAPPVADWTQGDRDGNDGAARERAVAADLDDVPPADADAATSRSNGDASPGYSEWAGTGTGGRDDGDYNLEAFVSAETTLADHLAEQLALAIADPARRMIGQYLIDMVDEAGYLSGDLAHGRGEARRAGRRGRMPCWRSCRGSILPACARAISRNVSPSSSRSATASIPRWRRWSRISICWPSATSRRCAASVP